ncbi:MAG: signal peptidase II [Candidatus Andersenbacteria bacterium]
MIAILLLAGDFWAKQYFFDHKDQAYSLLGSQLVLQFQANEGLLAGLSYSQGLLIGVICLSIFFGLLIIDSFRKKRREPLVLVLLGGLGNMFDRVTHGQVIDYIHLNRLEYNIADALIVIGVVWYILTLFSVNDSLAKDMRKSEQL